MNEKKKTDVVAVHPTMVSVMVDDFARQMKAKMLLTHNMLRQPQWTELDSYSIVHSLKCAVEQLAKYEKDLLETPTMSEAVDVANYAMMLYDNLRRKLESGDETHQTE